jgi:hypothetical protein
MLKKLNNHDIPTKGLLAGYLAVLCLLWGYFAWDYSKGLFIFASPHDRHLLPLMILLFASSLALLLLFAIIGIWFYVYHDAGQRGMNQWLWTFVAIFTPNLLGIVLYLILRKPILAECRGCGSKLEPQLLYCPNCGRQFKQKCPSCNATLEPGYQYCGSCGASLPAA